MIKIKLVFYLKLSIFCNQPRILRILSFINSGCVDTTRSARHHSLLKHRERAKLQKLEITNGRTLLKEFVQVGTTAVSVFYPKTVI